MNWEPTEEAISQLMAMGLVSSRDEAISKLKANGNDVQRAVEAIFETPSTGPSDPQQANNVWEESHFHAGKDLQPNSDALAYPSQASDHLQPNIFAPSRPPSRANDRSVIDLTAEHALADPSKSLGFGNEREEQDIQRAMALSMSELGPQETGVTSQKGVHFGPATREYYDASKWALTPRSSTHDVVLDPEPSDRRRLDGEPPFLRSAPSAPYLAPFLTILHSIPLAREALLCGEFLLRDYSFDDEWWSGSALRGSAATSTDESNSSLSELDQVIYETQRLMAFLDLTDRSYASVEGLARLDRVKDSNSDHVLSNFISLWQEAVQRRRQSSVQSTVFQSTGVKLLVSSGEELGRQPFSILELKFDQNHGEEDQSLYQAMDEMIWEGNMTTEDTVAYLEKVGEIFTIRVMRADQDKGKRSIHVPATWYPDRYIEESKDVTRDMRLRKATIHKAIQEIGGLQARIVNHRAGEGQPVVDPRKLLESSILHLERLSGRAVNGISAESENVDADRESQPSGPSNPTNVTEQLKTIYNSIIGKLKSLEEQKDRAREKLAEISALLTRPSDDPKTNPQHPYTLRGVSTDPNVTYVLCAVEEGKGNDSTQDKLAVDDDMGDEAMRGGGSTAVDYQWWKLSYLSGDSKPVTKTKVSEDEVLKAAGEEGKAGLLVYASERAMDPSYSRALSRPLINFIRADNRAFASELDNASQSFPADHHHHHQTNVAAAAAAEPIPSSSSDDRSSSPIHWGGQTPPVDDDDDDDDDQALDDEIRSSYFDEAPPPPHPHPCQSAGDINVVGNDDDNDDDDKHGVKRVAAAHVDDDEKPPAYPPPSPPPLPSTFPSSSPKNPLGDDDENDENDGNRLLSTVVSSTTSADVAVSASAASAASSSSSSSTSSIVQP